MYSGHSMDPVISTLMGIFVSMVMRGGPLDVLVIHMTTMQQVSYGG